MENYIETAYGRMYLTQERALQYMTIANKHIQNMLIELKENGFIPSHLSLEKTTIKELDDYIHSMTQRTLKRPFFKWDISNVEKMFITEFKKRLKRLKRN